jgi:hypothetical protein
VQSMGREMYPTTPDAASERFTFRARAG